jgi:hypothetical protein
MGALHINGQKTTGVNITLSEGVFMDANNTIKALTEFKSSMSYEATEDCFVMIYIVFGSNSMIKIDNKPVANYDGNGDFGISNTFYVKAGQTISVSGASASYNSYYIVYGIQQGTIEGKLQPVIYSTEEREVGVWTDGKPLYEKTIINDNPTYIQQIGVYEVITSVDMSDMDMVFLDNTIAHNQGGSRFINDTRTDLTAFGYVSIRKNNNDIYLAINTNVYTEFYYIIRYTKTTDQAGAGTWTPDGAYAHHYSTDEKVVGTWVDGSTLYEKTYDLGQDVTIKYNEWTEVNATKPNGISKYINIFGTQDDGTGVVLTGANPANATFSNVRLSTRRFQDESVRWFTIQYIKTT